MRHISMFICILIFGPPIAFSAPSRVTFLLSHCFGGLLPYEARLQVKSLEGNSKQLDYPKLQYLYLEPGSYVVTVETRGFFTETRAFSATSNKDELITICLTLSPIEGHYRPVADLSGIVPNAKTKTADILWARAVSLFGDTNVVALANEGREFRGKVLTYRFQWFRRN
jgi:hypothetical protein